MFERVIELIGNEKFKVLQSKKVLLIGVGGVGGTALECLVRSGINKITVVDYDVFENSNLNRQIISNNSNIGVSKVIGAKERIKSINPDAQIETINEFLNEDNIAILANCDYVIDACDSIKTKISIIKYCSKNNIKMISCMGMGNRLDPTKVLLTKLFKTENDPLAKHIRSILRKENISLDINVVSSKELPLKRPIISSMMAVPSTAGIYLATYVINNIIKE